MPYALGTEGLLGLNQAGKGGGNARFAGVAEGPRTEKQPEFSSNLAVTISYCADKPD